MSAENRSNPPTPAADREDFDLAARIAELHEQGILAGGDGPRGSLQNLPKLPPGALQRFLDREYRNFPQLDEE